MRTQFRRQITKALLAPILGLAALFWSAPGHTIAIAFNGQFQPPIDVFPPNTNPTWVIGVGNHAPLSSSGISWGVPITVSSGMEFFPVSYANIAPPLLGNTIVFAGILAYTNGTIAGGTGINGFRLRVDSVGPAPYNQFGTLRIRNEDTPNIVGNPRASADWIWFPDFPQFGSLHVLENTNAFVGIGFRYNSLDFAGFITDWSAYANVFSPELLAITGTSLNPDAGFIAEVPEAGTSLLWVTGLLLIMGWHRRAHAGAPG